MLGHHPSSEQVGGKHGSCLSCQPEINHSAERDGLLSPVFFCLITKSKLAINLHSTGRGGLCLVPWLSVPKRLEIVRIARSGSAQALGENVLCCLVIPVLANLGGI